MDVKKIMVAAMASASLMMIAAPAAALGEKDEATAEAPHGVPVYPGDITDRPYRVLGEVDAGVRKATIFSKSASEAKIYRELWERAEKMGADAVIKAEYGKAKVTLDSWGKTRAKGTAIKFLDNEDADAAADPAAAQEN